MSIFKFKINNKSIAIYNFRLISKHIFNLYIRKLKIYYFC